MKTLFKRKSQSHPMTSFFVRDCEEDDVSNVHSIYSYYVQNSISTLELTVPDVDEMMKRRIDIISKGFPFIVLSDDDSIVGYAYANTFRSRAGFNNTVEASVYLRNGLHQKGLGSILFSELIQRCTTIGLRQIVSVISSGSETCNSSIALHKKFGFSQVGLLPSVGYKFEKWVDCIIYQLSIGQGSTSPPCFIISSQA